MHLRDLPTDRGGGTQRKESASRAGVAPRLVRSGPEVRFLPRGRRKRRGRSERLPRHEGGKDSSRYSESGSESLARLRRGGDSSRLRCVGVPLGGRGLANFDRRGVVVRGGTGINVSDFQVHVFDLPSKAMVAAGGAQVKETGGSAGSSEPVRVVRFRKLAFPAAEAGATWQVANVSAKVRVKTPGGGGREPVVVGRTHTLLFFLLESRRPRSIPFPSPFLFFTPLGRMRSNNSSL